MAPGMYMVHAGKIPLCIHLKKKKKERNLLRNNCA